VRYVLPTTPNVCSYTTLVNMNCQISTCLTTGGRRSCDENVLATFLCRFCFIKLNLLLIAIENETTRDDDGVDTTIAINPDSSVKIDLNFQGFFIAESADDVKRFVSSDLAVCDQLQITVSIARCSHLRSPLYCPAILLLVIVMPPPP